MSEATVQQLEQRAAELDREREESFQRCDTDGFLSQWADGINASKLRLQAEIERNGGKAEFPALFDLQGNRVPAKLIDVRDKFNGGTKRVWALVNLNNPNGRFLGFINRPAVELYDVEMTDERGTYTVQRVRITKRAAAALARKGYVEGKEMAPARAEIIGTGTGLSGQAWAAVVRTDRGW